MGRRRLAGGLGGRALRRRRRGKRERRRLYGGGRGDVPLEHGARRATVRRHHREHQRDEPAEPGAPPTSTPSSSCSASSSATFFAFTLPPYSTRGAAAPRPPSQARISRCTAAASRGVALRPVPIAQTGSYATTRRDRAAPSRLESAPAG